MDALDRISTKGFLRLLCVHRVGDPQRVQACIASLLASHPGRFFTTRELISEAYADDPHGGPLNPRANISTAIFMLRKRGLKIDNDRNRRGYRLAWARNQA
jgi:hypothetical protein